MLRALEVTLATGNHFLNSKGGPDRSPAGIIYLGLTRAREELYTRINDRVDQMLAQGLVEEVATLVAKGYGLDLPAMQGLGYKELIPVVQGLAPLTAAAELIKKRTRNYAKRQETWFRREPVEKWFTLKAGEEANCFKKILQYLEGRISIVSNIRR